MYLQVTTYLKKIGKKLVEIWQYGAESQVTPIFEQVTSLAVLAH